MPEETEERQSVSQTQQNKDRIRRADSWRDKRLVQNQHDEKFIFLWIAFNAAYGRELYDPDIYGSHANSEKKKLETFFQKIIAKDEIARFATFSGIDCRNARLMASSTDPYLVCWTINMCSARSGTWFTARRETAIGVNSSMTGTIPH